jgi:glycosyltransferase 2 family protein
MKRWKFWLGAAISAFFLYYALRGLDLSLVWQTIQTGNYWWVLPGVAVYFVGVWARTWRWHYLLRPIKTIPLKSLWPVVVIGYMGNNIYPFRIGELLRAYVLKKEKDVSMSASIATILVERIFDGLVMLIFVFIGLPLVPGLPDWLRQTVILASIAFFGALIVFFVMAARPQTTRKLYQWAFTRFLPHKIQTTFIELADRFMEGLSSLTRLRDILMIFFTSVVIWLLETIKYWFVMHAFGFMVSFFVLMLMNGVVNLATTLPSAPGYVGTFDTPGIEVLKVFGVDPTVAAAYTLVLHAALWLPITLLGVYYMIREGLSWSDMDKAAQARNTLDQDISPLENGADNPAVSETTTP